MSNLDSEYPIEEVEEEVEEEVNDDEDDNNESGAEENESNASASENDQEDEDVNEAESSPPVVAESKPKGSPKSAAKPGKVNPSKAVKEMEHRTPESFDKKRKTPTLNPARNPFPSFGLWNAETFKQVKINIPVLTSKNETTNELTRKNNPEHRYWKGDIVFSYSSFTSTTIRLDNVNIPFATMKNYGTQFVYAELPPFMGSAFADAGKSVAPTKVYEDKLVPDATRWWKTLNNVSGKFGVVGADKIFMPKPLETIFDSTSSGITANLVLEFKYKGHTSDSMTPLTPTTVRTVAVELVKGYITAVNVNVQAPDKVTKAAVKRTYNATSNDLADDDLMGKLAKFGL